MNGYLLDTHVLLWLLDDSPRLGATAREALSSGSPVHVSAASLWEIAIKARTGKLTVPDDLANALVDAGLVELSVAIAHTQRLATVELPHRDPFDAMLVAQARSAGLTLVTADAQVLASGVPDLLDARA